MSVARASRTYMSARPVTGAALFLLSLGLLYAVSGVLPMTGTYGLVLFPLLVLKLVLSMISRKRVRGDATRLPVIITLFNEDVGLVQRCIGTLRAQTTPPSRIVVVDDASTDRHALEWLSAQEDVDLLVHSDNQGKREAMRTGFDFLRREGVTAAAVVYIDSDAELEPEALENGSRYFVDPRIGAVTGTVVPSNYDTNVLTRLIDVRYVNAFVVERGAHSTLDSVLCVCGVIAFYRSDMLAEHMDEFTSQTFLGKPAVVGDDRHMTNCILSSGLKTIMATDVIASTAVPERLSHYVRQQARWGRSFFRESLWALAHLRRNQPGWWLTLLELTQWVLFTSMLFLSFTILPILRGWRPIETYFVVVGIIAFARSVRYFDLHRAGQSIFSRMLTYALVPLFGYMNLLVMVPLRLWSLVTLRNTAWGTRATVEIEADRMASDGMVPDGMAS